MNTPVPSLLSDLGLRDDRERASASHVLGAARSLRSALRDDQDAADVRGIYSPQIHRAMLDHHLYDITTPKMFGGLQLPLPVLAATIIEIATGNPGSGWSFALATQHTTTVAAHWPEDVQRAVLGVGPFLAPHQFAHAGDVREAEGGFVIDGTYPFSSGAPYSSHVMISSAVRDSERFVTLLVPRDGYEVLDDWHGAFGMKASGSNSVRFDHRFVPAAWVIDGIGADLGTMPIGVDLHDDALYFGRIDAYHPVGLAAVAVGTARASLEELTSVVGANSAKRADPLIQQTLGSATALTDAAEALVFAAIDSYTRVGRRHRELGLPLTGDELATMAGLGVSAMRLAEQAVDAVFLHIGTLRITDGSRMQRYFRDISMLRTHGRFHPASVAVARGVTALAEG
jgi:3-hydroxy-9,10-secoandrosta-1,3,5(10)-triene-9,17-dione monooxygenase